MPGLASGGGAGRGGRGARCLSLSRAGRGCAPVCRQRAGSGQVFARRSRGEVSAPRGYRRRAHIASGSGCASSSVCGVRCRGPRLRSRNLRRTRSTSPRNVGFGTPTRSQCPCPAVTSRDVLEAWGRCVVRRAAAGTGRRDRSLTPATVPGVLGRRCGSPPLIAATGSPVPTGRPTRSCRPWVRFTAAATETESRVPRTTESDSLANLMQCIATRVDESLGSRWDRTLCWLLARTAGRCRAREAATEVGQQYRFGWGAGGGVQRFGFTGELPKPTPPNPGGDHRAGDRDGRPGTSQRADLTRVEGGTLRSIAITSGGSRLQRFGDLGQERLGYPLIRWIWRYSGRRRS